MDIVSLLSPEGRRSERSDPFGSLGWGLGTAAGLFLLDHANSKIKKLTKGVTNATNRLANIPNRVSQLDRALINLNNRQYGAALGGTITPDPKLADKLAKVELRKSLIPDKQAKLKNYISDSNTRISSYKVLTKTFSGIARVLTASMAFGFAEKLLTPDINKVAAQRDFNIMFNENPSDSSAAYTQRQRALMAIMDNQLNLNNVIGNEAAYLHR